MEYPVRIKMIGAGGHGIKLLGTVLAKIFADSENNTSLNLEYDAAVRGGNTTADIVIAKGKIQNPVVEQPDLLIITSPCNYDFSQVTAVWVDEKTAIQGKNVKVFPFFNLALSELESNRVGNMIILGAILKFLQIDKDKIDFAKYLKKFLELNLKAIDLGFNLI